MIRKGERAFVSTGISIQLPLKTYGRIASRSSLAMLGIDVGAGVIDPDYTGIVKVLLINNGKANFKFNPHQKIAQLIVEEYRLVSAIKVSKIENTTRGIAGFGSSGQF